MARRNLKVRQSLREKSCASTTCLLHISSIIRGARALLFPSLYEGFGLPVLEAMGLGTPVMTSTTASLSEVAGDAALLVDPLDIGAMTKAIQKIDADSDLRAELGQRGRRTPSTAHTCLMEFTNPCAMGTVGLSRDRSAFGGASFSGRSANRDWEACRMSEFIDLWASRSASAFPTRRAIPRTA